MGSKLPGIPVRAQRNETVLTFNEDLHGFRIRVNYPALSNPMAAVQNPLVAAIVTSRAGRKDLHDQVGRTLDVGFGYYARPLVGNEQNVRLSDIVIREHYIQRGRPKETQISVLRITRKERRSLSRIR